MYYCCILFGGIRISVSVSVPVSVAARVIAIEISLNILGVQKFLERQVSELPPAQPTNQPTFSMFLSVFQRFLAFRNFSTFLLRFSMICFALVGFLFSRDFNDSLYFVSVLHRFSAIRNDLCDFEHQRFPAVFYDFLSLHVFLSCFCSIFRESHRFV